MDLRSDFLLTFRSRLEGRNIPADTIDTLVGLISTALTTIDGDSVADQEILKRLVNACEDNIALLALITQQARELDSLKRITLNLTSSLELQVVLDEVVREALHLVKDASLVQIHLFHGEQLIPSVSLDAQGNQDIREHHNLFDEIINQVKLSREISIIECASADQLSTSDPGTWHGSILCVPLRMSKRLVGTISLARSQVGVFKPAEIRLLNLLADQASIAIVNARLHQAVSQQARIDLLTGLPNRLALETRLEEVITSSHQTGHPFSVIMLDLDNFKRINDSHGHEAGDDVLHQVAHFLQDNLRASDFVARYGGDEFALLLPDTNIDQAMVVVEKMNRLLADHSFYLPEEQNTTLSVSGGIAMYPLHAITPAGLLRSADEALYHAKRTNPGCFQVVADPDA